MEGWTANGGQVFRPFGSKEEAVESVLGLGFTEHVESSESGDWGPGSREYYCKPGAERNQYGYPFSVACISKVDDRWFADIPALPKTNDAA